MHQASPQRSLQWTLGLSCWFDAVAEEGPPTKAEPWIFCPSNSSDPFWKNCVWSTTERIHWKDAEIRRCWEMYLHYFRNLFKEKSNAQIWFLGVSRLNLFDTKTIFVFPTPLFPRLASEQSREAPEPLCDVLWNFLERLELEKCRKQKIMDWDELLRWWTSDFFFQDLFWMEKMPKKVSRRLLHRLFFSS